MHSTMDISILLKLGPPSPITNWAAHFSSFSFISSKVVAWLVKPFEMHSLQFSIGIRPAPTTRSMLLTKNNSSEVPSSAVKLHESLSRREVISFSLSLLPIVRPAAAAAAESVLASPCEFKTASSGLEYCDKVVGTGPEAVKGQLIKAHYVGRLEDGKIFDSSYNRGKPLTFRLGVGEVIKGWDQGILGGDGIPAMVAGGKRELRIPPALGYGIRGAGCRGGSCIIPPDSILLFDVEFVGKA